MRPVYATPESLAAALQETFGNRPRQPGRVKLEIPSIAENGSTVAVTVSVDSPMTEAEHVRGIYLFAEHNPLPRVLEVRLGPHNGRARVATRIRLATSQSVLAMAELSDTSLWFAAAEVEVSNIGCGG